MPYNYLITLLIIKKVVIILFLSETEDVSCQDVMCNFEISAGIFVSPVQYIGDIQGSLLHCLPVQKYRYLRTVGTIGNSKFPFMLFIPSALMWLPFLLHGLKKQ